MAAATQPAAKPGRAQRFGPNDRLLGVTTDATIEGKGTGAILWGMGVAYLRTARRLAELGISSLQVRVDDRHAPVEHFSHQAVAFCRAAMDKLAADRNVASFMLMGNCSFANVCLNTAIVDPRVEALILTNPHLTRHQILELQRWSKAKKVFSIKQWRRLFRGETDLRANVDKLAMLIGRGPEPASQAGLPGSATAKKKGSDMVLPRNLDDEMRKLADREVAIFIACSTTEPALRYLKRRHGRTIGELQARGALRFEAIDTDVHFIARDHDGSVLHSEAISRWLSSIERRIYSAPPGNLAPLAATSQSS
jgi:hypothetical protein